MGPLVRTEHYDITAVADPGIGLLNSEDDCLLIHSLLPFIIVSRVRPSWFFTSPAIYTYVVTWYAHHNALSLWYQSRP